jgi:Thioesterase-like superfamily
MTATSPPPEALRNPHPFDVALALRADGAGRFIATTSPAYWNMVGPYGGITAAAVLEAILRSEGVIGDPVALTVNYAAPIRAGEYVLETRAIRSNRTTQHWSVMLVQGDHREVMVSATAVFALRRPTWSDTEAKAPDMSPALDCPRVKPRSDIAWFDRYDMRVPAGGMSFGGSESLTTGWIRDDPPRPLDFPALASICDTFFPRVYLRRAARVPIGTVSLNIYFHADRAAVARNGEGYLSTRAQAQAYGGGFYDHHAQVWAADGTLLAVTQQIVWFKE